ncbi:MAG: suppressor of fused domain protein [Chitinophagales bacterium]|nr:suppressor of fused domain protein [Chitinophagales bacterium]
MGIWDVLKKKIANEEGKHHEGLEDHHAKNIYEIASFDINSATLSEKINYFLNNRSQGEQIQLADKLLREGPFEASIEIYQALIQKYPEERDRYENGIGSAYLKLGDFYKAIEYYITARNHGMHPDITDKNIWDACLKHHKLTDDILFIEKYFDHTENGKYSSTAKEILRKLGKINDEPIALENQTEKIAEIEALPSILPEEIKIALEPTEATPSPVTEEQITDEFQNIETVAKKDKTSTENQFSLFGFGEDNESTQETPKPTEKIESNIEEKKGDTIEDLFDLSAPVEEIEDNTTIPIEEAPNILMALDFHIDQFYDNQEVILLTDKRSDELRIDIYHILPNENRNYHLLVSSGMSRFAMNTPEGYEKYKYGELAILLPKEWDLSQEGLKNPNNYWPILWLKNLARIPKQHDTWLCYGHSIPNGSPSRPIANTNFEGVVIIDSITLPEDFQEMKLGEDSLYIYTVIPVYPEEMHYKVNNGIDKLLDAFSNAQVPDIVYADRNNSIED